MVSAARLVGWASQRLRCLWCLLQSHGREVDEEGWNSSGGDSEGVQRSAHSTPQAGQPNRLRRPFSQATQPDTSASQDQQELQVASRSRCAFIPRRLKQVLCDSAPLVSVLASSLQHAKYLAAVHNVRLYRPRMCCVILVVSFAVIVADACTQANKTTCQH